MGDPLAGRAASSTGLIDLLAPASKGLGMQVTRKRREVSRVRSGRPKWVGRRLRIVVAGTAAFLVVSGGMAFGSTVVFGDNQVGTQYPNGIQVSDDQIIQPIGDRLPGPRLDGALPG